MKKLTLVTALFMGAALYNASANVVLTLDEFGGGSAIGPTPLGNLNSTFTGAWGTPDANTLGQATLSYTLPLVNGVFQLTFIPGDLLIYETVGGVHVLSDVIRFGTAVGGPANATAFFYSDLGDGDFVTPWADVGLPNATPAGWPTVSATEDAADLAHYSILPADFGKVGAIPFIQSLGVQLDYVIDSSTPVPEPTTLIAGALLLLPFGASALRRLRKH